MAQTCPKCKEHKEFTEYHKNRLTPSGHTNICKLCRKLEQAAKPKARKRYYKLDELGKLIERECTHCREIKTVENFNAHSHCPGGVYTVCRPCKGVSDKSERKRGIKKYQKDAREYYSKNSEKIKKRVRKWRKSNPDKLHQYDKRINRRANIHKTFYKEMRELKNFIKNENKSASTVLEKVCLDHIIPIKNENVTGLNVPWNVQILSWSENACKSNKFDGTEDNESWRLDFLEFTQLRESDEC